jgi:hypothetical protein
LAKNPLFSTYRQGENRVTSSMLAVFERIDLSLLESILSAATGETALSMVTFTNQPPGAGHSVPDARISAGFAYWFEVKTARDTVDGQQIAEHLANLGRGADERLFLITPDSDPPTILEQFDEPRLMWFSFKSLHEILERLLGDPSSGIAEQQRFLLRELQLLLIEDGLVDTDDVVVVAARVAYGEYLQRALYVCQPERAFRGGLTHMGFYAEGAIKPEIATIRYREDLVSYTYDEAEQRRGGSAVDVLIADAIEADLTTGVRELGSQYQIFVLSAHDDSDTVRLPKPIKNDTVAESGRRWAWTLGQRYVSLSALMRPNVERTSQLSTP